MADDFGNGVTRNLNTLSRSYSNVVWQAGKPPLDSELNLVGQLSWDNLSDTLRDQYHSGFLTDPIGSRNDYAFNKLESNAFRMKPSLALVNGWVLRVESTDSATSDNMIKLDPPPSSDSRTDFVFLEAWRVLLEADPSADNKPAAQSVYHEGNVLGGVANPTDEMIDGAVGFETTRRVQVQYRIRVVSGVDIGVYTEGLGAPNVLAQGTKGAPVQGLTFSSMGSDGDRGLFRAGDANDKTLLGTVDGYVYAIPVCSIFRRNSSTFVADGVSINMQGSVTRTPSSINSSSSRLLSQASLSGALTHSTVGAVNLTNLSGSGLDDASLFLQGNRFFVLGSGDTREVIEVSGVDTGVGTMTIASRGRAGTQAKNHVLSTEIALYNIRPDGVYADEITSNDLLDMRHTTLKNPDYHSLLSNAVREVLTGELKTTFKTGDGNLVQDTVLGVVNTYSQVYDGTDTFSDMPNGIRQVWGGAGAVQRGITLLIDPENTTFNAQGISTVPLNNTVLNEWTTKPDFNPMGFFHADKKYRHGTSIFLQINGVNGGANRGLGTSPLLSARFCHPREQGGKIGGDQHPFKIRLAQGVGTLTPSLLIGRSPTKAKKLFPDSNNRQALFLAPSEEGNYQDNFMVLGELLHTVNNLSTADANQAAGDLFTFTYTPLGGTARKIHAVRTGVIPNTGIDSLLLETTDYFKLITNDGREMHGSESKLFLHLYGDSDTNNGYKNSGVFKVIALAGQEAYNSDLKFIKRLAEVSGLDTINWTFCERIGIDDDFTDATAATAVNLIAQLRVEQIISQSSNLPSQDIAIVFTTPSDFAKSGLSTLSTTVQWSAGRYGTVRTQPKAFESVAVKNAGTGFLRNTPYALDSNPNALGLSSNDVYLPTDTHVSRMAKSYHNGFDVEGLSGGSSGRSDLVETEAYFDTGSNTAVLRPYQKQTMTLISNAYLVTADGVNESAEQTVGENNAPVNPWDGGGLFTANRTGIYLVPFETLPPFGAQDIPYHVRTGANDPFLSGLNHLFIDSVNNGSDVHHVIGGEDNSGASAVYPILFGTSTGSAYGTYVINMVAGQEGYAARKVSLESSLKGIELPPNLGIARVYGVYEKDEFNNNANVQSPVRGAHDATRTTPIVGGPTNLMKEDASRATLYITKDSDGEGKHRYAVTETAIDITRISTYVDGMSFNDFDYIVEAVVFGFADYFIERNNIVLARKHDGQGNLLSDGVNGTVADEGRPNDNLMNVEMVFPSALPVNTNLTLVYKRGVYQGDPFHTKGVNAPSYNDEGFQVLRPPLGGQNYLKTRDMFDADGNLALDLSNKRDLEVLASMDFSTTLGTGSVGGALQVGSLFDVGYLDLPTGLISTTLNTEAETVSNLFTAAYDERSGREAITLTLVASYHDSLRGGNIGIANDPCHLNIYSPRLLLNQSVSFDAATYNDNSFFVNVRQLAVDLEAAFSGVRVTLVEQTDYANLIIESTRFGDEGGAFQVGVRYVNSNLFPTGEDVSHMACLVSGRSLVNETNFTKRDFATSGGAKNIPMNGGTGLIPSDLVGMTTRLPLGALAFDSIFRSEDFLNDGVSFFSSAGMGSNSYIKEASPTFRSGASYTSSSGVAGELLQMVEGYGGAGAPFRVDNVFGTKRYTALRGNPVFHVGGDIAGAPVSWSLGSVAPSSQPVLKSAVLACRAILVRNFKEVAFEGANVSTRTQGDELQLVILSSVVQPEADGSILLGGEISPSGYGEGYASSDRYRITGRPLVKGGIGDHTVSDVTPAPLTIRKS